MKREIVNESEIDNFVSDFADAGNKQSGQIKEPQPFTWIGGKQLAQMVPRSKQMVVDKILPAGSLTINASKAKSGKTTLMIELCHAVSTGRAALGHYPVLAGPVLYWLPDDANVERFSENWRLVTGGLEVENFHLCTTRQNLYPEGIANLRASAERFRPVLIVVDSYTTIRTQRPKGGDFVKAEYDDMRVLSELASETTAAVSLIHHQSKMRQSDPFDAVAGSYAMGAGVDNRMVVEKLEETERLVRVDGRDLDAFALLYARGTDRRLFRVIDGSAAIHWERLRIVERKHRDASFTAKDAGEVFGLTDRQARRILGEWERIEAVSEAERGRYVLAPHVTEAATRLRQAIGD
jgi:RecA-family ATPase